MNVYIVSKATTEEGDFGDLHTEWEVHSAHTTLEAAQAVVAVEWTSVVENGTTYWNATWTEGEFWHIEVQELLGEIPAQPGVMHDVDASFYRLTVKERDAERQKVDRLAAELADFYAECDAVGIPHSAAGLVRHHRGNAGLAAAANAMTEWIPERNALRKAIADTWRSGQVATLNNPEHAGTLRRALDTTPFLQAVKEGG